MMKHLIAVVCFMLAAAPLALAQEKAKDAEKKTATATEKASKAEAPKARAMRRSPTKQTRLPRKPRSRKR